MGGNGWRDTGALACFYEERGNKKMAECWWVQAAWPDLRSKLPP
jgi:hypothetical protein